MSWETISLISILTLLGINLRVEFFLKIVVNSLLTNIKSVKSERNNYNTIKSNLKAIENIYLKAIKLVKVILFIVVTSEIILLVTPNLRSEFYLLLIGMFSSITYCILFFTFSYFQKQSISTMLDDLNIATQKQIDFKRKDKHRLNPLQWLSLITILVAYWSFLHYALNPKVIN